MILKSELNARNKITAIRALAIPVLRYSFGIINWRTEEIKKIDRKTRKMLKSKSSPVIGLEWPRGFQEVKVPRFHDNGTGWR